ncbi:type I-C CRISPR-associated protein Cas8c/Csd1 [Stieleria sp. TO1_6]|uniref:type I-C CRISPR-associated protein Cas8c/Csd1 n=1 Tax=Stieleria tagensis TaxID=2956795 RepID=UPI00209B426B|nr:type I-C CRISPR-associated protein Cas8c/Csd1 [Stieleria tagensis]MCO8124948.1 type I-C CRISPR-associated protein Cas8c/Csd1 [Stieleria tagensis]
MILQHLCEYYDRVAADPSETIAEPGFAPQNISFVVLLDVDGTLTDIQDVRDTDGKTPRPKVMRLPDCGKRTSGVSAQFLWDKADYLLGWINPELLVEPTKESESDKKKRLKKIDRIAKSHKACADFHLKQGDLNVPQFNALCRFFEHWTLDQLTAQQLEKLESVGTGFGVFRVRGEQQYLHEIPALRDHWIQSQSGNEESGPKSTCLVSGDLQSVARLHPSIKGVRGAQSSGASIVSFNKDAFTSYGKKQSYNAPVGESATFRYTTALNKLLQNGSDRRIQIGDTTYVFWADQPTPCEDLFGFGIDPERAEDEERAKEAGRLMQRIAEGECDTPDAGVPFHVLGLSPNASRLSIRFWISDTAGELIQRVSLHQQRLKIVRGAKDRDMIPLWLILAQTARESKEIPPLLGGALLRSVLTGGRYPESLLAAIIRRIRADREINHVRAATIKAVLSRNYQLEISVMLDPERPEPAYQMGRLFAALERAQEDALGPGLNATIKDRYFGAASSTPASVFPRLIRMSQHHVSKLEGGRKVVADKRLQEIMGRIDRFPGHLGLLDQGLFAIGYYHQRQDFFTKKTKDPNDNQLATA